MATLKRSLPGLICRFQPKLITVFGTDRVIYSGRLDGWIAPKDIDMIAYKKQIEVLPIKKRFYHRQTEHLFVFIQERKESVPE